LTIRNLHSSGHLVAPRSEQLFWVVFSLHDDAFVTQQFVVSGSSSKIGFLNSTFFFELSKTEEEENMSGKGFICEKKKTIREADAELEDDE
jgi:hypothetical protein